MKYFNVRNRAILSELVRTDFKVRYQGSILGYAWSLLRPLLLFATLYVIFVYVIPLGKGVEHFPVYLLTGVILWSFFIESTSQGLLSIVNRGDLLRKINIPRYLVVVSSSVLALINLMLSMVVLLVFALLNGVVPNIGWLMIIPLVCELFVLSLGASFLLSSLYVRYRDIAYIWEVFLQIGFYASAIIYPLSSVASDIRKWFFINPIVQIIQDARYFMATKSSITLWSTVGQVRMFIPFVIITIVVLIGAIVFRRRSKSFAEEI